MFRNIASINWASVIMSIISVIILIIFKEFINPKVKAKIKMPVPIELVVVSASFPYNNLSHYSSPLLIPQPLVPNGSVHIKGAVSHPFSVITPCARQKRSCKKGCLASPLMPERSGHINGVVSHPPFM